MAFVHGKDSYFSLDSANLTTYLTDVNLNTSADEAETSTMGSEAKTFIPGMTEATISISGRWDPTATTGPDAVIAGLLGDDTPVAFEYGPGGNATGAIKKSGNCFVTSYNPVSPMADVVVFTATMRVTGAVTEGTFS